MVDEEADEAFGRECLHAFDGAGPDGRTHRQDVVFGEAGAVFVGGEVVAEALF
jgi:hypothetical protein